MSGSARRGPKYVPDEVLVRFRPGVPKSWRGIAHAAVQGQVKREYGSIEGLELVKLPPGLSVSEAIDRYRRQAEVLYAEPNYPIYPTATPNDPSFGLQWALHNIGQSVNGQPGGTADADIDAPEAWNITTGSNTVVIAVIDTGIGFSVVKDGTNKVIAYVDDHPDLAANMVQLESNCFDEINNDGNSIIVNGQPFSLVDDCRGIDVVSGGANPPGSSLPPYRTPPAQSSYNTPIDNDNEMGAGFEDGVRHHGTRTAGIIGAKGNNTPTPTGIAGVNWDVKLLACKALAPGASFNSTVADAIQCLDYVIATKNVHPELRFVATNNSWTLGSSFSQSLFDAIKVQRDNGLLFIVAADNGLGGTGTDNDVNPVFPATYYLENVIAVAATDRNDNKAGFSNFGRRTVHLGAPGQDILSTVRVNAPGPPQVEDGCTAEKQYCFGSGTSFSAPQVSGVAALLKAQDPNRDWKAIKNLILAGGDNKSSMATTTISGKRLNAHGALTCANSFEPSDVVATRLLPVANTATALLN
ncbi:MAG: S8 family serine peptidase, partial [Terriglobia bacterium]